MGSPIFSGHVKIAHFLQAARRVRRECPGIDVQVFSDRDIADRRGEMEAALQGADVFFGSLLFDYDQVPHASSSYLCPLTIAPGAMHRGVVQASFQHRQPQASYEDTLMYPLLM